MNIDRAAANAARSPMDASPLTRLPRETPAGNEPHDAQSFADARDDLFPSSDDDERPPETKTETDAEERAANLSRRLEETTVILRRALNNEFVLALEMCAARLQGDLYASLAHATLSFLRAALTLEPADLQEALESINHSFKVSNEQRHRSSGGAASMVMRFLYRPNYDQYTDAEVHAELVHAESLLIMALISFLADQSILCLVRGALRIRACYSRYKECLLVLETKREWQSEPARRHFESGVRMGHGIFNLLMSYLPRRVLRFLQYVGFSGDRSLGVDELERSVALDDGLRSVFSTLVILTYHTYVENLFGLGSYDMDKVRHFNAALSCHYPRSAFYLLFAGRYHQMQGDSARAIDTFERCIAAQDDWRQFHSICHWEMMWCYAVQMDWRRAAHYSDLLRRTSKWSPASYTYQYATFLYAQLVEDEREGRCARDSAEFGRRSQEIRDLMRSVPSLRIRYAGKTIPAEKFAITRSEKFLAQGDRLALPALEFLYIWNIFCTLTNGRHLVDRLLARIEAEIEHIRRRQDSETSDEASSRPDDLALMHLLKGMCLKHLGRSEEAEASFLEVVGMERRVKLDTFIVPHTLMELAILNLALRRYDCARRWIKLARTNYTGYLLETIVHFRLHAASRAIRIELGELEASREELTSDALEPPPECTRPPRVVETES